MLSDNLNDFVRERLACPISKKAMKQAGNDFQAPCGFLYKDGDFRIGLEFQDKWAKGQKVYEDLIAREVQEPSKTVLSAIDEETRDVYAKIKMTGDILDIGGGWGTLAKQADMDTSRYVCVDPMVCRWSSLSPNGTFAIHYSSLKNIPRIVAFAEFLPFADATFDTVHIRSCLDHMANAVLALRESFRVLRPGGKAVIGLSLERAYKKNSTTLKQRIKRALISLPGGWHLFELLAHDAHIFHPTYENLVEMITKNGFSIKTEVWQEAYHNVIYFEVVRP